MEDKKEVLYQKAKELFSTKGYKDTSIADIMELAGYSIGTFYNYYKSKDALFVEVFADETVALMKKIMKEIATIEEPIQLIKRMMELNEKGMQENLILKQWYYPDVFARIEKFYRLEKGIGAIDFIYQDFYNLILSWQEKGMMKKDIEAKMIMAIFGSIIQLGYHKEEIGIEFFPELQYLVTEFVLKGLTDVTS